MSLQPSSASRRASWSTRTSGASRSGFASPARRIRSRSSGISCASSHVPTGDASRTSSSGTAGACAMRGARGARTASSTTSARQAVSDRTARSRSFESVAAEYERHRPEYPEEALRWASEQLGLAPGAPVLDVGAGTAKLPRGLVALGFDAVAVEPGASRFHQLRSAVPEVEALEAPAESIPLPDESVEAAFAGQAYHWFDGERALPELHRVLKLGGGLALLWNWWDERDQLQRELGELVGFAGHAPYPAEELPGEPWFREVDRIVV